MKYVITEEGINEYRLNRQKYREPSVYNKIICVLISGVAYSDDSLLGMIQADPMIRQGASYMAKALETLVQKGYIKQIGSNDSTPALFRKEVAE